MIGLLLSGMLTHNQRSIRKNFAAFVVAIFCGFMQNKFSLGSASMFSQDEWSWKPMINWSLLAIVLHILSPPEWTTALQHLDNLHSLLIALRWGSEPEWSGGEGGRQRRRWKCGDSGSLVSKLSLLGSGSLVSKLSLLGSGSLLSKLSLLGCHADSQGADINFI